MGFSDHTSQGVSVEAGGPLVRVGSLPLSHGSLGLKSGYRAWQVPLPHEPYQPQLIVILISFLMKNKITATKGLILFKIFIKRVWNG